MRTPDAAVPETSATLIALLLGPESSPPGHNPSPALEKDINGFFRKVLKRLTCCSGFSMRIGTSRGTFFGRQHDEPGTRRNPSLRLSFHFPSFLGVEIFELLPHSPVLYL